MKITINENAGAVVGIIDISNNASIEVYQDGEFYLEVETETVDGSILGAVTGHLDEIIPALNTLYTEYLKRSLTIRSINTESNPDLNFTA